MNEAQVLYDAVDSGEWEITRHQPVSWLTDEANELFKWSARRAQAPYCGKDGVPQWNGPTPSAALEAARKSLGDK